ncbi:LysR family transcriptional regulator [Tropicimonas sp.]|uniref:LysR family transcriptional regulator n=1 Tax=Tropicimonas sp. TaxID=2067044 RepID=UPI003A8AFA7B
MHRGFDMAILSRLRFKQLALVASLAETANLHASARELNLSQPGATKLLREVENTLGVELFIRKSRGMEPTVYGDAVARHARLIISETVRMTDGVAAIARGELGTVRLGAIMEAVPGVLADVLESLLQSGNGPLVNLTVSTSDHLIAALDEGQLDLALGRPVEQFGMDSILFEPLWDEELSIIASASHPLAGATDLTLEHLRDCDWILQPRPSPMRTSIELAFSRAGLPLPTIRLETSSMLVSTTMVSRSGLVAVLPRSVARFYAQTALICQLPVHLDSLMGHYGLLRTRKNETDPAIEAVARRILALSSPACSGPAPMPDRDARR